MGSNMSRSVWLSFSRGGFAEPDAAAGSAASVPEAVARCSLWAAVWSTMVSMSIAPVATMSMYSCGVVLEKSLAT
jgi:hypothetical protein